MARVAASIGSGDRPIETCGDGAQTARRAGLHNVVHAQNPPETPRCRLMNPPIHDGPGTPTKLSAQHSRLRYGRVEVRWQTRIAVAPNVLPT